MMSMVEVTKKDVLDYLDTYFHKEFTIEYHSDDKQITIKLTHDNTDLYVTRVVDMMTVNVVHDWQLYINHRLLEMLFLLKEEVMFREFYIEGENPFVKGGKYENNRG